MMTGIADRDADSAPASSSWIDESAELTAASATTGIQLGRVSASSKRRIVTRGENHIVRHGFGGGAASWKVSTGYVSSRWLLNSGSDQSGVDPTFAQIE